MTVLMILIQAFAAWAYSHVLEYAILRFMCTHVKKAKTSLEHYIASTRNTMVRSGMGGDDNSHLIFEMKVVFTILAVHSPTIYFSPTFFITLFLCGVSYLMTHRACHRDVSHARRCYSWHYDHHMSGDSSCNFSVRSPFLDRVLGTRRIYKGTKKEKIMFGRKLINQGRATRLAYAIRVATMRSSLESKADEKKD